VRTIFNLCSMACFFMVLACQLWAQDCSTGQCFRSASDRVVSRTADVIVSAVEIPVRVVERVVCESQPVRSVVACNGLAQWKAERQAASNRLYHVGGGFAGGCAEGVGFSTSSAEAAIKKCCYWGQKPVQEIGVARGRNGWYATVIYRSNY
jgi:hypothetical protein